MTDVYRLKPEDQPEAEGLKVTPYSLNTLGAQAYLTAHSKGFHRKGEEATLIEQIALIMTECAEAIECIRKGQMAVTYNYKWGPEKVPNTHQTKFEDGQLWVLSAGWRPMTPYLARRLGYDVEPVGLPTEIADILIRTLDTAHLLGFDIDKVILEKMEYNETRPAKHGGKLI